MNSFVILKLLIGENMKFALLTVAALLSTPVAFSATLNCRGTHGNVGTGTLELGAKTARFVGTQVDKSLRIKKSIRCEGGLDSKSKINPAVYDSSVSCNVFSNLLVYESGVLFLVDDSGVSEPQTSATYFCH